LLELQTAIKSAEKEGNYAKEFERKVRQEEKRLLQLLKDEEATRFVSTAH